MSDSSRLENLLTSLGMEILSARAGSREGQFPILDLLGNLRDEAARAARAEMSAYCQQAWERMAAVVESGQSFTPADNRWLKDLLTRLQTFLTAKATDRPAPATAPEKGSAAGKEEALVIDLSSDVDLLGEFTAESREHLDQIEEGVLVLETNPDDHETLNTIFRAFHTFKGSAGFLNLVPINQLAHAMESLLDLARLRKLTINPTVIDLILRGRDTLRLFVDEIDGQLSGSRPARPTEIPTADLRGEVQVLLDAIASRAAGPDRKSPESNPGVQPEEAGVFAESSPAPAVSSPGTAPTAPTERSPFVKVETEKLDALLDLVGEMVISQSLVAQNLSGSVELDPQFVRNMAQLSRTTKELQRVSMSMRMVPIRGAFQKMARVVRDIAAKQNKKVQLLTHGEDTELDRNVVEQLNDPLLHLIRNSVDHGIETAEARRARGKPAVGSIHLRAYHQGGNIIIEISDDGAGLDCDRIRAKAVECGLATPDAQLSDEETFAFIFAAGLSTAEKVTDISGRGVGLDVVRRNLEQLRGCVDVSSIRGQGAQFKLTLPLTLAIIDGLVVRVGEEQYIVPTVSVRQLFRPKADMISTVHGAGEVVNLRGRLIPVLRLYDHFGVTPSSTNMTDGIGIVIQSGTNARCLLVDALVTKQEVVIRNLNDLMVHKNRSLAGAAILGDGRVGLILDVNNLVHPEPQGYSKAA